MFRRYRVFLYLYLREINNLCFLMLQIVPWDVILTRKKILKMNTCKL